MTFTISQNAAAVSDGWLARAFDPEWADRPGGQPARVAMLAVKQAAAALGGHARVSAAGRGMAVSITVPAGMQDGSARPAARL